MKATLERLFRETLAAIALDRVIGERVHREGPFLCVDDERIELDRYQRIFIAAIGKAAYAMTAAMVELLDDRPVTGIAVGPTDTEAAIGGVATIRGRHPYPDEGSLAGARALLDGAAALNQDDLFICLLSGGGSALAECPGHPEIALDDLTEVNRLLVTGGADIVAMNVVRKHLSAIKGGRLAAAASPARQVTLYVSDVPDGHPDVVASGPTMPDVSTHADMVDVIRRLDIADRLPGSVRRLIERRHLTETLKPGDAVFARSSWHCLIDNTGAIAVLSALARQQGWAVEIDTSVDDWRLEDAADALLQRLRQLAAREKDRVSCLISGGELSCPVRGDGRGGRNQAFVLYAAQQITGANIAVLSAGTDGIDGNSPAAGAVADGGTIRRAEDAGLSAPDHERRSDAYTFFHALGDDLVTGPTGNNVRDLRLLVCVPG